MPWKRIFRDGLANDWAGPSFLFLQKKQIDSHTRRTNMKIRGDQEQGSIIANN